MPHPSRLLRRVSLRPNFHTAAVLAACHIKYMRPCTHGQIHTLARMLTCEPHTHSHACMLTLKHTHIFAAARYPPCHPAVSTLALLGGSFPCVSPLAQSTLHVHCGMPSLHLHCGKVACPHRTFHAYVPSTHAYEPSTLTAACPHPCCTHTIGYNMKPTLSPMATEHPPCPTVLRPHPCRALLETPNQTHVATFGTEQPPQSLHRVAILAALPLLLLLSLDSLPLLHQSRALIPRVETQHGTQ
mmetsp:Transcript_18091/g.50668  ORF Transcript_18091/g.50668 Transcript_18091/m.50668 type:complete len:243 (+) Transcript_18091:815-1543(+)